MEKVLLRLRLSQMLDRRVPRRMPPSLRRPPPPLRRLIGGCRQVMVSRFDGPVGLELRNVDFPPVFEYDVLVRVRAVSINTIDLATSYGLPSRAYLPSPPFALGYDFSGEGLEVGPDVEGIRAGEDVFGVQYDLRLGGTYSEYLNFEVFNLIQKPDNITYEEASAIPYPAMTAWAALLEFAKMKTGERVLIVGGDEIIGYSAIQLAVAHGCHVVTTCRGENIAQVLAAGAKQAVDCLSEDIQLAVKGKFDVVFDTIGAARTERIGLGLLKRGIYLRNIASFRFMWREVTVNVAPRKMNLGGQP